MKWLVLSDCHANVDALRAVWQRESDCDRVLFAGDMVDFGFDPRATVEWFMALGDKLIAVRGNHDEAILTHRNDPPFPGTPRNFQEMTYAQLAPAHYAFLAALPHETTFTLGDTDFYMCHTTDELSDDDMYLERQLPAMQTRALFNERFAAKFPTARAPKRVIVYGHSHLQWAASAGPGQMMLNPGSLSYRFGSFEPVRCADYMVLENGAVSLRHVDFATDHLYARAADFADPEAARLARAFYRREDV